MFNHTTEVLPIEALLPDLLETLGSGTRCILEAAPGAGKTTRVPLALLRAAWLDGKGILMLEPRRMAARNAARYMASLLGEKVGQTVGVSGALGFLGERVHPDYGGDRRRLDPDAPGRSRASGRRLPDF